MEIVQLPLITIPPAMLFFYLADFALEQMEYKAHAPSSAQTT